MKAHKRCISWALKEWRRETIHIASPRVYLENQWCKFILSQGWDAVPVLIHEIKRDPSRLAILLHMITGEDPTKRTSLGDFWKMGREWQSWWKRRTSEKKS